jgi:hypothetical protein
MKILNLHAENVKRLRVIDVTPGDDPIVIIGGANGQGKSSALDAIQYALGGKRGEAAVPIRRGANDAAVDIDLGGLRVSLRIEAGRRELVVTDADGKRQASPQAILDRLYSRVTFDPLAFTRDEPAKQLATLRAIVGLDFAAEDAKRAKLYQRRTETNRMLKNASERLTAIPGNVLRAPDEEVNIGELMNRQSRAAASNQRRRDQLAELERLRMHREALQEELEKVNARIAEIEPYVPEAVDTGDIEAALRSAQETNRAVAAKQARAALVAECLAHEQEARSLTEDIEKIDAEKSSRMAAAPWPVPGLGFDETGVLLNGLPFEQASSAEQLRVGLAVGAALHPQLRVLLIQYGSLLDDASMLEIRSFAQANDMQVWIERVGAGDPGAIIIEDGQVQSLDGMA